MLFNKNTLVGGTLDFNYVPKDFSTCPYNFGIIVKSFNNFPETPYTYIKVHW